ncbi:MAG: hypothetical protein ACI915_003800 [Gammaproteobacteria bacterium]|jgi:hypothetical protein
MAKQAQEARQRDALEVAADGRGDGDTNKLIGYRASGIGIAVDSAASNSRRTAKLAPCKISVYDYSNPWRVKLPMKFFIPCGG